MNSGYCKPLPLLAKYADSFVSLILLSVICVAPASAGFINASNTNLQYASGKSANLQGLEWLSLDHTANISRTNVESSSAYSSGGWRYATKNETATLLGSLWGASVSGYSTSNHAGANWFINNLGGLIARKQSFVTKEVSSYFFFGNDTECSADSNKSCVGTVTSFDNRSKDAIGYDVASLGIITSYVANSGQGGAFYEKMGLDGGYNSFNYAKNKNFSRVSYASLLVRDDYSTAVPEPAPITLMGIGLLLGYFAVGRFKVRS